MRFTRILAVCFLLMACLAIAEDKPAAKPAAPSDKKDEWQEFAASLAALRNRKK